MFYFAIKRKRKEYCMLHGPWNIGSVLLGFHSKNCDTGGPPFKLWLCFKCMSIGSPGKKRVSEKIVEGHMAELVLVVWKPCVTGICPRRVRVRCHTGGSVTWQHARSDHRTTTRISCPQIVLNLEYIKQQILLHLHVLTFVPLLLWNCIYEVLLVVRFFVSCSVVCSCWVVCNFILSTSSNYWKIVIWKILLVCYTGMDHQNPHIWPHKILSKHVNLEYSFYSHDF